MNTIVTSKNKITFDQIAQSKTKVRKSLREQKELLTTEVKDLFSPFTPDPGTPPLLRSFSTGMAIYEGVMTGVKIIKRVRKFLHRKR